ncbi:hypothetical protein Bca4012_064066 [Brassica carinata]|uniref:Pectin acetylesterase n=1 Tax=Brassica carinata TaxID=52824 RepID=A0A8X7V795_BRACI|nr:hypothetical protein Bca52824_033645 [Brassica carinata]
MKKLLWSLTLFGVILILPFMESKNDVHSKAKPKPTMVGLTLIKNARLRSAVCLDGSPGGYHIHRGSGSGAKNWLVHLEGGEWCSDVESCVYSKRTRYGSSKHMEKQIPFTGILSDKASENPDFYNWNRVKIRYCDGGSFMGDNENKDAKLQFRGKRIWNSIMTDLLWDGMEHANQALLSGCSAGGLAAILLCHDFKNTHYSNSTKRVKCLSDAGFFVDAVDVSGGRSLRKLYTDVIEFQTIANQLPDDCLERLNPTSCFFAQNLINKVIPPLFILNAAYDSWQIQESLTSKSADPSGSWSDCSFNIAKCNASQIKFFQGFRTRMVNLLGAFKEQRKNGVFLNSCFSHCQTESQDTWYSKNSPAIKNKRIAVAVGDWFFERGGAKLIDCPYPCDKTCRNLI